jgi:hypothetical protein
VRECVLEPVLVPDDVSEAVADSDREEEAVPVGLAVSELVSLALLEPVPVPDPVRLFVG